MEHRADAQAEKVSSTRGRRRSSDSPQTTGGADTRQWREQILKLLAEQPLNKVEISQKLGLPAARRQKLRGLLTEMERGGEIARIRRERYILPEEADLVTGIIQFRPSGSAFIDNEKDGGSNVFVSAENTWTAMQADRVVARIIKEPTPALPARGKEPVPSRKAEARVIRILERGSDRIVGTLQKSRNFHYVVADDPRFVHNLYVPAPAPPLYGRVGDKVVARLDSWPSRHINPEGTIIEVLGPATSPGVDMLGIIRKNNLPTEFPEEVIREAERIPASIPRREIERREDLRDRMILTIDPDDARDFDDAIEVEKTPRGWQVWIHIADVAHYVRPKSPLDREARARGNSVYLADRVLPMLPEALSNGICSLRPNEDRLTHSVIVEVTQAGRIRQARFAKTVIRSAARLTYKEAFARLQKPPSDEISKRLHTAWEFASLLRTKRFEAGSLNLDFPEIKVWLDENGKPVRLEKIENDISHQLIEELMLLANECVARELKRQRQPALYRIHEKPDQDRLNDYRELALSYGYRVGDLSKRSELQKLLDASLGKPEEYAIKVGLLKSLKRAAYSPDPLGHYGLAKTDYTHFTSPIRRYADLVVHRALERLCGWAKGNVSSKDLAGTADHISTTERIATEAERESVKLKKLEYFQRQISDRKGEIFKAIVLQVRNYGMVVDLPDYMISGLVHVSSLDDDFYQFDASRGRFVGRRRKRVFQVGDALTVGVSRVDIFKQQVDFCLRGPANRTK